MELSSLVADFASALAEVDATNPVGSSGRFKPGCGPLTESELTTLVLRRMREKNPAYSRAAPRRYSSGRAECDFVLPGEWAVEVKLARPFGDMANLRSDGRKTCFTRMEATQARLATV